MAEPLSVVPRIRLERVLSNALGNFWQIGDTCGPHVLGPGACDKETTVAVSLRIDIEIAGQLVASHVSQRQYEALQQSEGRCRDLVTQFEVGLTKSLKNK